VEIFDQLAMVTLDETYAVIPDTSQDSVFTFLGAYTLTLPQGAEISELALSLYDSLQPQPIVRFQDAQRFHEGVSIGSEDPLFPENDQENIFRIGLYPVTESVNNRVVVKYFLTLPKVGDVVEFRLPISRRIADTKFKLSLKSQTPIDSVWTPNNLPITCPSEMECSIDYFTPDSLSDFLLYYAFAEERLYTALSYEDPNPLQDGYFILWTTPPDDFFDVDVEIRDRHIVFCLDVSTAMGEELAPVRNSLETIINQLRSTDVLLCELPCSPIVFFPISPEQLSRP